MRRFLKGLVAALLALAPAAAMAQTGSDALILFGKPKPALDLSFTGGALPSVVTFTRASSATDSFYTDAAGSSFNTYTSGVPRLLVTGFVAEDARTQSLVNSATPVTQTTGSLSTGTYVFWCIGTGSDTSSAGTATASGLGAITCSQGTFQTIIVTVAGTLTFTKSGSIDRFQLELGGAPTSFISSAGSPTTRGADVATVALSSTSIPAAPSALTIIGKYISPLAFSTGTAYHIFELDDATLNNRVVLRYAASANSPLSLISIIGGVTQFSLAQQVTATAATTTRFWAALAAGNSATQMIGQAKVTSTSATPLPSGLTTIRIGEQLGIQQLVGPLARLQIYNLRLSDGRAAAIAAGL